jgi:hypothetical protein
MFYGNYQPVMTLRKDQVEALFNSLFITTNYQPIKINYFKTEDMTLPTDKEKISEMLDSLIVSATISNEIVNSSVVVLDDVMSPYIYNSIIGEELFINDSELANLVHALTFGFGITDINGLSYDGLAIPNNNTSDYNDKIAVISNSALIRASITKEIVRNDDENSAKKAISIEDNTDVCGIYTEYKSLNRVVVVTSNEIMNLINGVNVLNGSNDNGDFSNISVNISELMGSSTDAHDKRSAVINSSILRSILSNTLTESTITGVPYYVYLNQLSVLNPNYVPMEPTLNVKVYKSFVVVEGEVADLFSASELEKLEFAITN